MPSWRALHDRSDLASRLRKQGSLDEAIQQSRELIRLAPRRPSGYYELAQCFREQGRFADALPYFEHAAQLGYDFAKDLIAQCRRELNKPQPPA